MLTLCENAYHFTASRRIRLRDVNVRTDVASAPQHLFSIVTSY